VILEVDMAQYFTENEIACPCCGKDNADSRFLSMLDMLRYRVGHPIRVHSFCRCEKYNKEVGGVSDSAHLDGLAADLEAGSTHDRGQMIYEWADIIRAENDKEDTPFRVEVGKTYIHLDISQQKVAPCVWLNIASVCGTEGE